MYVCMYVCVYVCMHVCIYVRMRAFCMCTVCMYVCVCRHWNVWHWQYAHQYLFKHAYTHSYNEKHNFAIHTATQLEQVFLLLCYSNFWLWRRAYVQTICYMYLFQDMRPEQGRTFHGRCSIGPGTNMYTHRSARHRWTTWSDDIFMWYRLTTAQRLARGGRQGQAVSNSDWHTCSFNTSWWWLLCDFSSTIQRYVSGVGWGPHSLCKLNYSIVFHCIHVFKNNLDLRCLVQGAECQVVDARPPFHVPQARHLNIGLTTSLSFTWSFQVLPIPCVLAMLGESGPTVAP